VNYTAQHTLSSTTPLSDRSHSRSGRTDAERGFDVSEQALGSLQAIRSEVGERSETPYSDNMEGLLSGGGGSQQQAERQTPPHSNTGVLTALADWLSLTFPENVGQVADSDDLKEAEQAPPLEVVKALFGSDGWVNLERGDLGYKQGMCKGRIRVYFDGNPGMGIHVRMSGQACRELEGMSDFKGWQAFLASALSLGAKFTRFDVAMDDDRHLTQGGDPRITMQAVEACVDNGQVVSTYRDARGLWKKSLHDGSSKGYTLNFGSRQSDSMIRFYDKGLQMGMPESYVRVELELHDRQAQAMAKLIADGRNLGELLAGVLRRKLDFKEVSGHSQRERRKSLSWWIDFLAGVEKMRLGVAPIVRTLQKGMEWAMRQVAPMLALIQDYSNAAGLNFMQRLRSEGLRRRSLHHTEMLSSALVSLSTKGACYG